LLGKKIIFLTGILSTIVFAAGSTFAGPPTGSLDESYYEGIWNFRITEKCNRTTDAGMVSLPLQNVYMTLKWDGAVYQAKVYPTIADARWGTNIIGEIVFSFDLPWQGESWVSDVEGSVDRDHPKFNGSCELKLVVCLKTAVNSSKNPLLSKMSGWGIAYCEPDDTDTHLLLKCRVNFLGKWVEALQFKSPCQTNADCASGDYCEKEPGDCGGVGECAEQWDACIMLWDPVCGCDGNTHSNAGCAAVSGTNVDYPGVCQ